MGWRSAASWVWSAPQRAVLSVLVGAILLVIVWRAAIHRTYLDDPPPANPPRAPFLADRIDLNTADRDMLVTLPGIGPSRAQAIISRTAARPEGVGSPGAEPLVTHRAGVVVAGVGQDAATGHGSWVCTCRSSPSNRVWLVT